MLYVFGGAGICESSPCALSLGFFALGFISLSLMGVSWVQPSNVKDVLVACRRRMKKSWVLGVWNMVPLAIWWATWKERNRRVF